MKAALSSCGICGVSPNAIDLGAGRCRRDAESCLWNRALRKWRVPRARQVVARIEAWRKRGGERRNG
jgi:hypothetical protein